MVKGQAKSPLSFDIFLTRKDVFLKGNGPVPKGNYVFAGKLTITYSKWRIT